MAFERERNDKKFEISECERVHEIAEIKATHEADAISLNSNQSEGTPKILLKNVMQKFVSEKSDHVLFLLYFKDITEKTKNDVNVWVTNLLGLLPVDIAEIILCEPTEFSDDFEYVRNKLLKRFKLIPEDFNIKFVAHQRQVSESWTDYAFTLTNYLDGWLQGMSVTEFEQLRKLIIAYQLKFKVSAKIMTHVIES